MADVRELARRSGREQLLEEVMGMGGTEWWWEERWVEWLVEADVTVVESYEEVEVETTRRNEGILVPCGCRRPDGSVCQYVGTPAQVEPHRRVKHKVKPVPAQLAVCNACHVC